MEKRRFPSEIMIEATNYCNNRCFFCGSIISKRKRGIIDKKLMLRLIKEAYELGARKISFHGMGEPLICKELAEYIQYAKECGYEYVYLDSNGVLASPEVINPILDAGLDSLKFSIHSATKETYCKITNSIYFDKVYENFIRISNYIKEKKLNCKLIGYFAESTINTNEVEAFVEMFGPYATDLWIRPIHNGSGAMLDNIKYSVNQEVVATTQIPCSDLSRMIINWEGKAIACCTDWTGALIYGDSNEQTLEELWNCEGIWKIRKQQESKETLCDICKKCMGIE